MKLFTNVSLPTSSAALKRVNVLFEDKILKISPDPIESEEVSQVIDLKGMILLPGAVDAHSHIIREKDPAKTIARVSKAAIKGGWTSLAELSYLDPKPITSTDALSAKKKVIKANSFVDMALWGNVDIDDYPYHAEAAQELWGNGIVGIALMNPSPNPELTALDFTEIMDLFLDIYGSDTAFSFQGFDVESHSGFSFASQGDAIRKLLRRMQENPIHIPRVSSFETVEFINSISKRSDISFSLCLADLMKHFSDIDFGFEVDLEGPENQFYILLRTNKIYMLSNNVESAEPKVDLSPAFQGAPESLLPFSYLWALSELWKKRKIPLATVIKMTSENAAKRLGIYPEKGSIAVGSDADFVVYDPTGSTDFKAPDGSQHELEGAIVSVYLRGESVVHKGKVAPATGAFLHRSTSPKRRHNSTTWI